MMRLLTFIVMILLGLVFAIALSNVLKTIDSTSVDPVDPNKVDDDSFGPMPLTRKRPWSKAVWPGFGQSEDKLFWVLQLSDLHISAYRDPNRGPDLQKFCEDYLPVIQPKLVMVTGDLTDAKQQGEIDSRQIREEWIMYRNIARRCSSVHQATWLDIRGNHDAFDVYDYNSENNFYRSFSVMSEPIVKGRQFGGAYHHQLHLPFGVYSFIGVDASAQPGPNRPFNFFGHLDNGQMSHLRKMAAEAYNSNQTVWFGHFPSSVIVQDSPQFRNIMRHSIAYVCGHLHTLGDFVPQMYAKQKTGQLELELGDWKFTRMFRIMAFDNDVVTFADFKLGDWPLVVILNPKEPVLLSDQNEPVDLMRVSSHIRLLVFSSSPIKYVNVYVDGVYTGEAFRTSTNLYVKPWVTKFYEHGIHTIRIIVKDKKERVRDVTQKFCLDPNIHLSARTVPRLLLMLNIYTVVKVLYWMMALGFVLVITYMRQCDNIRTKFCKGRNCFCQFMNGWLNKLWLGAVNNSTYYCSVLAVVYMSIGPWFVGDMLTDHSGLVFIWGILLNDQFLPGSLTYFYGIFQLLTFNIPLFLLLSHLSDVRIHALPWSSLRVLMTGVLPTVALFFCTLFLAFTEFPRAYGLKALLFGPLRTGNIILFGLTVWNVCVKGIKQTSV